MKKSSRAGRVSGYKGADLRSQNGNPSLIVENMRRGMHPKDAGMEVEAAEYLATLPVRAFATDALGVESVVDMYEAVSEGARGYEAIAPLYHVFLTREIPA